MTAVDRTSSSVTAATSSRPQESARTSASRSELIRRAVLNQYGVDTPEGRLAALRASAGTWSDRSATGADYVEELRSDLGQRWEQVGL